MWRMLPGSQHAAHARAGAVATTTPKTPKTSTDPTDVPRPRPSVQQGTSGGTPLCQHPAAQSATTKYRSWTVLTLQAGASLLKPTRIMSTALVQVTHYMQRAHTRSRQIMSDQVVPPEASPPAWRMRRPGRARTTSHAPVVRLTWWLMAARASDMQHTTRMQTVWVRLGS